MADMFDYLQWRGELPFSQVPPTPVDALILSSLVYTDLSGIVAEDLRNPTPLHIAANVLQHLPDPESRHRTKSDLALWRAAGEAPRFRNSRLAFYRTVFIEEEETQFAAMGFLLEDGSAFLAFRGTDYSLVGWKEDFNMSFRYSIPAQREALAFTEDFAAACPVVLHLGGHSKGGNLAVYAAAKASPALQSRILSVYNLDGPGFTEIMMGNPGYLRIVPKIRTYIPESSIIGMLLEHEEPYTVIKSRQIGPLQHEPYSWDVMGGDFIHVDEISSGSRFIDRTVKNWIAGMSLEERSIFVDALYALFSSTGASTVGDLFQPKNILAIFKALNTNEQTRKLLTGEFVEFLKAASKALPQNGKKEYETE